jgi:hypothetical protein
MSENQPNPSPAKPAFFTQIKSAARPVFPQGPQKMGGQFSGGPGGSQMRARFHGGAGGRHGGKSR